MCGQECEVDGLLLGLLACVFGQLVSASVGLRRKLGRWWSRSWALDSVKKLLSVLSFLRNIQELKKNLRKYLRRTSPLPDDGVGL